MNKEIKWNIINSILAGMLVFLGSLSSGEITYKGILFAIIASLIIAINKFKEYWEKEEEEYKNNSRLGIFHFIG